MMFCQDILSLKKGSIIFDVKCSNALPKIIKDLGGNPIMSPTGHFHIKNGIKKHNPLLAGEMSGHIFFNDRYFGFDDAIYAAIRLMDVVNRQGKKLSTIRSSLPSLINTPELRLPCEGKNKFSMN